MVDERSLMRNGFGSSKEVTPQLHHARFRLNLCGATHGQYLLDDVLANPPDCKLLLVAYARDLEPARRARLEEMKRLPVDEPPVLDEPEEIEPPTPSYEDES